MAWLKKNNINKFKRKHEFYNNIWVDQDLLINIKLNFQHLGAWKIHRELKMVVKAVCVINGDAKGTVFFEQEVNYVFHVHQELKSKINMADDKY